MPAFVDRAFVAAQPGIRVVAPARLAAEPRRAVVAREHDERILGRAVTVERGEELLHHDVRLDQHVAARRKARRAEHVSPGERGRGFVRRVHRFGVVVEKERLPGVAREVRIEVSERLPEKRRADLLRRPARGADAGQLYSGVAVIPRRPMNQLVDAAEELIVLEEGVRAFLDSAQREERIVETFLIRALLHRPGEVDGVVGARRGREIIGVLRIELGAEVILADDRGGIARFAKQIAERLLPGQHLRSALVVPLPP